MIKPQFFGYTSYAAYRAAFREKALRRNIDPAVGATSYQHVLLKAEQQTTTHFSRMSNAVWANANLESGWARYGGVIERIELMAGRDWWKDELFWNGRCAYVVPSKSKMPAYMYRLISLILPPDVSALEIFAMKSARSKRNRCKPLSRGLEELQPILSRVFIKRK